MSGDERARVIAEVMCESCGDPLSAPPAPWCLTGKAHAAVAAALPTPAPEADEPIIVGVGSIVPHPVPAGEDATLTAEADRPMSDDAETMRRIIDSAFGTDPSHGLIAKRLAEAGWVGPLRGAADRATLAAVRALVESWPHGNNGQEYRRAVTQCRTAILALLDGCSDGTSEDIALSGATPDAGGGSSNV